MRVRGGLRPLIDCASIMSVGSDVIPESSSALSCSAGGLQNGNGKVKSLSRLSTTTRSCSYTSPPLKKSKKLITTSSELPSVTETFVFSSRAAAPAGERRGITGPKTTTRKAGGGAITMPIEHVCNPDYNLEELQLENVEEWCFPSQCVGRLVPEETWQHKTSEKVTQWLEDSCQSSVTGILLPVTSAAGCVTRDPRDMTKDYGAGQDDVASHSVQGQAVHSGPERRADASSYKTKIADQTSPGTTLVSPADVQSCSEGRMTATVCGIRYSIRCLKMIACLPIVLLGLYLKIKPNSWEQFEPPPT